MFLNNTTRKTESKVEVKPVLPARNIIPYSDTAPNYKYMFGLKTILYLIIESSQWDIKNQKSKKKVQGVPQLQTAALPRYQEEEKTDKSKQAQIE